MRSQNSNSPSPVFLTFSDIANRIPVSEKTLRNKVVTGTLPFPSTILFGRRVVLLSDFNNYLLGQLNSQLKPDPVVSPKKRGRTSNAEKAKAARLAGEMSVVEGGAA